ncbi:protein C-mannosyl-transferase DPY19L1-like [Babylonia areolata]|uniref:protein C-mannosyl-transferase DPY19L1-like n=1 Tax=Babylonia areolata TaxID=304850 RepID=UPI003FD326BF
MMAVSKRHPNQADASNKRNQTRSRFTKRNDAKNGKEPENTKFWTVPRTIFVVCLAIGVSVIQRNHVASMFENDRHFSHLSTLERELAFRTEMGLYYSYFKTIITAKSTLEGMNAIMYDNITEYPSTINTLKRFNLYPEVALGLAFRVFDQVSEAMKWQTKVCYTVSRGQGYEPVQSCEGLGEPAYFYVESVFLLNGLMMGVFFLFGTFLSGCPFGGVVTVAAFFFNHGECTRVQWTPPLRESFAYPFFVLQMLIVAYMLRCSRVSHKLVACVAALTTTFMACWQFAQFALLTQMMAVFGTFVLQYITVHQLKGFLLGQTMGFLGGYILLFGNEMLLTSYFASCLLTIWIIVLLDPLVQKLSFRVLKWVAQGVLLVVGTLGSKVLISKLLHVTDDAHIGEILRSKFTDFKNFHTMLYTCAKEFDFLEAETYTKLTQSLLLPSAMVAVLLVAFHILRYEVSQLKTEDKASQGQNESPSKASGDLVYVMLQLAAFTVMAVLIMRLKMFWTPHLCVTASLLASRRLMKFVPKYNEGVHSAVLVALLAGMGVAGYSNLAHQRSVIGEFSNYPMEELVEWIKASTPKDAVFAGPMPTMATIKLCTHRPIVNHPHYEDAGLRERTKQVYSMYSRKPAAEVKQNLLDLKVNYAILENSWCVRQSKPGCRMPEMWDMEDEENRGREALCTLLRENPAPHFSRVFRNDVYDVLKTGKPSALAAQDCCC